VIPIPWVPPDITGGRTYRYTILRACERLDPYRLYGRPFNELNYSEQLEFLGFSFLRDIEDSRT